MAGASTDLAGRLLGKRFTGERAITVDQTNHSVVVDEAVIVKWLRPPVRAPHPGVQLVGHLSAMGFLEMPRLLAVHERDGLVEAVLTEFLPGAVDGWEWYVDDVERWLTGALQWDALIETGARLGAIAARLHDAASTMQPDVINLSEVADRARRDQRLARERLDDVEWLDDDAVAEALAPLRSAHRVRAHRIHGDLHVGNVLRAGDTLLVSDFDGNPLQDLQGRSAAQSPLRDVASLLQSIVHVGAVVVKRRRPDRRADVDAFVDASVAAALHAYRGTHDVDPQLLQAFRVAQELHEYAYAIEHLPHWRYVADDALPRLLAEVRQ